MTSLLLLLLGCDEIDALLVGVADPDVAEGLVLGVRTPPELDLTGTDYGNGGAAAAYLTTLGDEPNADGTLALLSESAGNVAMRHEEDGVWATPPGLAFTYTVGDTYILQRDGSEILRAEAAPAAAVSVPSVHATGAALSLDAGDADFDSVMAVVLNLDTGAETWSNAPGEAGAAYELLIEEPILAFDIPGEAFAASGHYAVGVAGIRVNDADEVTDVNSLASLMGTGLLEFRAVTVE